MSDDAWSRLYAAVSRYGEVQQALRDALLRSDPVYRAARGWYFQGSPEAPSNVLSELEAARAAAWEEVITAARDASSTPAPLRWSWIVDGEVWGMGDTPEGARAQAIDRAGRLGVRPKDEQEAKRMRVSPEERRVDGGYPVLLTMLGCPPDKRDEAWAALGEMWPRRR